MLPGPQGPCHCLPLSRCLPYPLVRSSAVATASVLLLPFSLAYIAAVDRHPYTTSLEGQGPNQWQGRQVQRNLDRLDTSCRQDSRLSGLRIDRNYSEEVHPKEFQRLVSLHEGPKTKVYLCTSFVGQSGPFKYASLVIEVRPID